MQLETVEPFFLNNNLDKNEPLSTSCRMHRCSIHIDDLAVFFKTFAVLDRGSKGILSLWLMFKTHLIALL